MKREAPLGTRYLHVKTPDGTKYQHTIAYLIESSDAKNTLIRVDRANVHPNDNFSRKKGREISGGRLAKYGGDAYSIPLPVPTAAADWTVFEDYVRSHF